MQRPGNLAGQGGKRSEATDRGAGACGAIRQTGRITGIGQHCLRRAREHGSSRADQFPLICGTANVMDRTVTVEPDATVGKQCLNQPLRLDPATGAVPDRASAWCVQAIERR